MDSDSAKQYIYKALRRAGYERSHKSPSGSCYYEWVNWQTLERHRIRISNHELPQTDEREYNHSQGWTSAEDQIIILDDLEYSKAELNAELTTAGIDLTAPTVKRIAAAPLRRRCFEMASRLETEWVVNAPGNGCTEEPERYGKPWFTVSESWTAGIKKSKDVSYLAEQVLRIECALAWEAEHPNQTANAVKDMIAKVQAHQTTQEETATE